MTTVDYFYSNTIVQHTAVIAFCKSLLYTKCVCLIWQVQSDVRIMLKTFSRDLNNLKQSLLRASSSYHVYPSVSIKFNFTINSQLN